MPLNDRKGEKKEKQEMKKITYVLAGVVLAVSLVGCSSVKSVSGGESEEKKEFQEETQTEVSSEDGYGEGRFGDVMKTYFFSYCVNSAYLCDEYNGYLPADGKRLLVADVTVKNTYNESIEMYDTDFQVQWNTEGEDDYDVPITYYTDPVSAEQLPTTYELSVNEEKTGLLVFEVPEGYKDFSISYLEMFDDESEGDVFFVYFTADEK